jgi:serine/threonine-protein kinase 24/25/MST4
LRYHKDTNETVAIKVIDLDYAEDDVDDIMKEIAILAQMNSKYVTRYKGSQTLVDSRYFGSYIKGSQLWIVMEYCGGASCADMV